MKERFDKMVGSSIYEKRKTRNRLLAKERYKSTAKRKLSIAKRKLNFNQGVSEFKNKVKEGPYCICVACNRCLYKKYVK